MSRTLLNWGIFLIVLGAIPLAVRLGVLDSGAAQQLLRLWPLILVGIGIGLLLRVTAAAPLGGAIVAATAGMLAGALLAGGIGGFSGACTGGDVAGELVTQAGSFEEPVATAQIEMSCVGLTLDRQAGTAWSVEAQHASGAAPVIESGPQSLSLRSGNGPVIFPFGTDTRRGWRVSLPQGTELSVGLTLNASNGTIGLGGGPVALMTGTLNASDVAIDLSAPGTTARGVNLTLNASSGRVSLPPSSFTGDISLNASSLNLCVAPEVGLRIDYDDTLSSDNFGTLGLSRDGDIWQDQGYASASQRIDLDISANVSSITLSRAGACE